MISFPLNNRVNFHLFTVSHQTPTEQAGFINVEVFMAVSFAVIFALANLLFVFKDYKVNKVC